MAKVTHAFLSAKGPLYGLDQPVTISYNADEDILTVPESLPSHIIQQLNHMALMVIQTVSADPDPTLMSPMMVDKYTSFDLEVKLDDWSMHVITTTPIKAHHETTNKITASGSRNCICLGLAAIFGNVKHS